MLKIAIWSGLPNLVRLALTEQKRLQTDENVTSWFKTLSLANGAKEEAPKQKIGLSVSISFFLHMVSK